MPSLVECTCCGPYSVRSDCAECRGSGFTVNGAYAKEGAVEHLQQLLSALIADLFELRSEFEEHRVSCSGGDTAIVHEQVARERQQAVSEYHQSLQDSNRLLRDEVRLLAESMGLKPVRVGGERFYPTIEATPLLSNRDPSKAADAISIMVRQLLKQSLSDDRISEAGVRQYVDAAIGANLQKLVRDAVGIEDYGRIRSDSPLKKRIEELVQPLLSDLRAEMLPEAVRSLKLQDFVNDWMAQELRDLFIKEVRSEIRSFVVARAEELARSAAMEVADDVIMEEMPFLKKYLAMKRLGKDVGR